MFKFINKSKKVSNMGVKVISTVERPETPVQKLSNDEIENIKNNFEFSQKKVDPYFIQEIVDRICGPDSEDYKRAISELNNKFKSRPGKTGRNIFE
jgi:Glu-tRNA(Gln) amidotransferase subunit E-like FAD-binding protein